MLNVLCLMWINWFFVVFFFGGCGVVGGFKVLLFLFIKIMLVGN